MGYSAWSKNWINDLFMGILQKIIMYYFLVVIHKGQFKLIQTKDIIQDDSYRRCV